MDTNNISPSYAVIVSGAQQRGDSTLLGDAASRTHGDGGALYLEGVANRNLTCYGPDMTRCLATVTSVVGVADGNGSTEHYGWEYDMGMPALETWREFYKVRSDHISRYCP